MNFHLSRQFFPYSELHLYSVPLEQFGWCVFPYVLKVRDFVGSENEDSTQMHIKSCLLDIRHRKFIESRDLIE